MTRNIVLLKNLFVSLKCMSNHSQLVFVTLANKGIKSFMSALGVSQLFPLKPLVYIYEKDL